MRIGALSNSRHFCHILHANIAEKKLENSTGISGKQSLQIAVYSIEDRESPAEEEIISLLPKIPIDAAHNTCTSHRHCCRQSSEATSACIDFS